MTWIAFLLGLLNPANLYRFLSALFCETTGACWLLLIAAALPGCSAHHWLGTQDIESNLHIGRDGLDLKDSKDNKVSAKNVKINRSTGEFSADEFNFENITSGPMRADGDRSISVGQGQMSQVAYLKQMGDNIRNIEDGFFQGAVNTIEALDPIMARQAISKMPKKKTIQTPWGSFDEGVGFSEAQIQMLEKYNELRAQTRPAP